MKKLLIFISIIFLLTDVWAIKIGYSESFEYSDSFKEDIRGNIVITPNKKNALVVDYSVDAHENINLDRIDVNLDIPDEIKVTPNSKYLDNIDVLTGSNGNYKISINKNNSDIHGVLVFDLIMPNVLETTEYPVTLTTKLYSKDGKLQETKTGNYKYIVIVKPSNCNNDSDFLISSNLGELKKENDNKYTLSTNESVINLTISPKNNKTSVLYWGYSSLSWNNSYNSPRKLENNSTGDVNLENGINHFTFALDTECSNISEKNNKYFIEGNTLIGIKKEDFLVEPKKILVDVTRVDSRSNNNTLKSLSISDINISLQPELKEYTVTIPSNISFVKINSTLTDNKSTYVSGYGNRTVNLKEGLNVIQIKVKAENGDISVYNINITREKIPDSGLKTITVDKNEIPIQNGVYKYSITVDNSVLNPEINVIPIDETAKIEIKKNKSLKEGNNEIKITVTASNGIKSNYVLNIVRDSIVSSNSKLKKIDITNHEISFNSDELNYLVHISYDTNELSFNIEPENNKATYTIIGNNNLENNSVIKIKVIAEDQVSITEYTIKIEKYDKPFNIWYIIVPSLLVVIIILIIAIRLRKKSKNKADITFDERAKDIDNDFIPLIKKDDNISDLDSDFVPKKKH